MSEDSRRFDNVIGNVIGSPQNAAVRSIGYADVLGSQPQWHRRPGLTKTR